MNHKKSKSEPLDAPVYNDPFTPAEPWHAHVPKLDDYCIDADTAEKIDAAKAKPYGVLWAAATQPRHTDSGRAIANLI